MEKWQKSRNYRRIKDQNGTAISFVITVDGMDVEVTEEELQQINDAARWEGRQPLSFVGRQ